MQYLIALRSICFSADVRSLSQVFCGYHDDNGEIGDICAWQTRTLGGYTIQLEWSNNANQCV